jgi:hypothetical protein
MRLEMGLAGWLRGNTRLENRPRTAYSRILPGIPAYWSFRVFRTGDRHPPSPCRFGGTRGCPSHFGERTASDRLGPPGTAWDRINFFLREKTQEKSTVRRVPARPVLRDGRRSGVAITVAVGRSNARRVARPGTVAPRGGSVELRRRARKGMKNIVFPGGGTIFGADS